MSTNHWERSTDKRLDNLERKVDKMLDPETGIYARLDDLGANLRGWLIGALSALILNLVGVIALLVERS